MASDDPQRRMSMLAPCLQTLAGAARSGAALGLCCSRGQLWRRKMSEHGRSSTSFIRRVSAEWMPALGPERLPRLRLLLFQAIRRSALVETLSYRTLVSAASADGHE